LGQTPGMQDRAHHWGSLVLRVPPRPAVAHFVRTPICERARAGMPSALVARLRELDAAPQTKASHLMTPMTWHIDNQKPFCEKGTDNVHIDTNQLQGWARWSKPDGRHMISWNRRYPFPPLRTWFKPGLDTGRTGSSPVAIPGCRCQCGPDAY
jgi:hypothetical protein